MARKKLIVRIGNIKDMSKDFIKAWHQAESSHKLKTPIEKITFESEQELFKILTPRRCDLLKHVREYGKITIRALAKALNRDYSNVYQDVKILKETGFILKNIKDEKFYVPWDIIVTEIPLTELARPSQVRKYKSSRYSSAHSALHR